MVCGIYLGSPKSGLTDKVYIGQSSNIEERVRRHNNDLISGKHTEKMQKAFEVYGPFDWEILLECEKELLDIKEKYFINLFNAFSDGFNSYEDSTSAPILFGLDNGNTHIERLSIYKAILDNTILYPNKSRVEIAELSNAKISEVKGLWYGADYIWVKDIYPNEYNLVRTLSGNRHIGGKSAAIRGITYPCILNPELEEYIVDNVRQFALSNGLDKSDLTNVLNLKAPSVKRWIVKDLNILNPALHNKFYSSNRGNYKKQFDLYIQKQIQ